MGALQRIGLITRGKVNELLNKLEGDGEAVMQQTIVEAKVELAQQKQAAAEVKADYDRYKKQYDKLLKEADEFHGYAVIALKGGDEEKAAKNLGIEKKKRADAEELKEKLENAKRASDQMLANYNKLADQVREAEDTMREVKRNNRVAGAAEKASKGVVSQSAMAQFDRLAAKTQARYDVATALGDIDAPVMSEEEEMRREFGGASGDTSVEMEALRKELGMA